MKLAVETTGEGPPVLLVHGFPDSGRLWRHQIGPLVEAGYRVIAPDLRGFGESPRPPEVDDYRVTTVAADLLELLDEPAHVVGHDWGAGIAWALAVMHPDRVRSLAALSVGHPNAGRPPTLEAREKAWYQLLFQFEEAEELLLRDDAALLREWLGDAADAERYVADLSRPGALTAGLNYYRANLHPRRALEWRPLPPVAAPTLGVWSSGDRYLVEDQMRRSGEHVSGPWRYERVDGAGHWMQLDAPEAVTELLLSHLSARG
jgi:pimeloyl-ACP methyl ester carboxylesterase